MMTAQFIFTVLFILVSHGMEPSSKPEDKQFPSGDYVIILAFYFQNGFGEHEALGREVHIQKIDKPSPQLILQKFKKVELKTRPISTRLMNGKKRLFVESNSILDTIVYEDGTPQLVIWKLITGEEDKSFLVLAKKEANLPSLLKNKEWLNKVKKLTQNWTPYDGWTHEDPENVNETSGVFKDNQFQENLNDSSNQEGTYINWSPQILKRDYLKEDTEKSPVGLNDEKEIPTFDFSNGKFLAKEHDFKEQMNEEIKRNSCRLCDGYICVGQPFIGHYNLQQGHAICLAGYGGKRCHFYPKDEPEKLNFVQKLLLDIFKDIEWLNTHDHMDFIWTELEKRGWKPTHSNHQTIKHFVCQMRILNHKIAHWRSEFKGKHVDWYIHRDNWQQPEDVNWQKYITEILKVKHVIPVVNFSYTPEGKKPIIPHKILDFIKQHTNCLSFEQAVEMHMPNVEIFDDYDLDGMLVKMMRLKNDSNDSDPSKITESRFQKQQEVKDGIVEKRENQDIFNETNNFLDSGQMRQYEYDLGNKLYDPNFVPRNAAKFCNWCKGAIKDEQLHIHANNSRRGHVLCAIGFCGYEDCFQNNIFRKKSLNQLQKAILSEFEALPKYYCMGQPNHLLDKLKQRGAPFENVEDVLECIKTLRFDLHSYNFFSKNGPPFVIHRKHWKEPEDVDWKTYIVEILKRRPVLPVVDFSYEPRKREEVIVPPGLLRFIKQCTELSSFEEALEQIDEVEVFYCGTRGKCMRLKQTVSNEDLSKTTESRAEEHKVDLSELKKLPKQDYLKTESRSQEQKKDLCDHTYWLDNPPENNFRLQSIWTDDDWYHCTEAQDDDCFLPNIDYELDEQTKKKHLGNVLDDDEDPEFPQIRMNKTNANPKSNKKGK